MRSRAHYLETEVIPVHTSIIHDGSALHADAAPRVLVLQPSNLTVLVSATSLAAPVVCKHPKLVYFAVVGLKKV